MLSLEELRPRHFLAVRMSGPQALYDAATNFISSGTAYGVFYAAALGFGCAAAGWALYQHRVNQKNPDETLISARSTQKWWGITASFFSSAMGAWVLTAPAEVGAVAGWWGVIGYALATAYPWVFVAIFGPRLRNLTDGKGFTSVDFVKVRLGKAFHIFYLLNNLGMVFLAFVVEATTIGDIFTTISPDVRAVVVTASLAAITFAYTFACGLRATLLADRIQFVVIVFIIIIGVSAVFAQAVPQIDSAHIREVGKFTNAGFICLLVLNVSCFYPTFCDPSTWSRMYAAESARAARKGLLVAAGLLLIPMTFFGAVGIFSQAAVDAGVITSQASPFFALLTIVHPGWSVVLLLLATCLSTSTIDTFSAGFATVVASEFGSRNLNYNWARLVAAIVFVLALITAVYSPASVMTVFMVANLISAVTTPVLLLSLWSFVSSIGCAAGILAGFLTVNTFGWVRIGTFKGGFEWWLLPEDYYGAVSLWTFILTGVMTTVVALGASQIHFLIDKSCHSRQQDKFELLLRGMILEDQNQPDGALVGSSSSPSETLEDATAQKYHAVQEAQV